MRLLGRLLFLAVVLAGLALGYANLRPAVGALLATTQDNRPSEATSQSGSTVYRLDDRSWARFPFSRPPDAIRVLSHADAPPTALQTPGAYWPYGMEYEVRDALGTVLRHGSISLAAQVPSFEGLAGGPPVAAASYSDSMALPSATDPVQLDLSQLEGAAEIRLRALPFEGGITAVAVRVYERRAIPEGRYDVAWQRLRVVDRLRIAQGLALPAGLLTPTERDNLLANRWLPIGPSGVAGRDYFPASLKALDESFEGVRTRPAAVEPGVYLDAGLRTTITLPEAGGAVRLAAGGAEGSVRLGLTLHEQGSAWTTSHEVVLTPGQVSPPLDLAGGLLEIAADRPVRLRVWLETPQDTATVPALAATDLTADPASLRVYGVDEVAGLEFRLSSLEGIPTPFRLALRCQCPDGEPVSVHFALLDREGTPLHEGDIDWTARVSAFDRLRDAPDLPLSDPEQVYFNLPPAAALLRLTARHPVLAAGYNRPPDLMRAFAVPEDDFALPAGEVRRLTWFALRPEAADAQIADGRAPMILSPERPPQDDPEILAGRYIWEQFLPEGDWLSRDLLVPRGGEQRPRAEALAAVFFPVELDRAVTLRFVSAIGSDQVLPELAFLRAGSGPMRIDLRVDGTPFHSADISAARGLIALPTLKPGPHRIEIAATDPVSVYLNQLEGGADSLLRRRALRLPVGETVFQIEKRTAGEELVVGHVFPQSDAEGRQDLRLTLLDVPREIGPLPGWTIADRLYSLRLDPAARDIPVLGSDRSVGPDRTVRMVLGPDVPPGLYRLRVRLAPGEEVYFALSRALPGVEDSRVFFQE